MPGLSGLLGHFPLEGVFGDIVAWTKFGHAWTIIL